MGEVIPLGNITRLDLPVDRILDGAKAPLIDGGVVVLGWTASGDTYFASSIADGGSVIWLLEKAKKALLEVEVS